MGSGLLYDRPPRLGVHGFFLSISSVPNLTLSFLTGVDFDACEHVNENGGTDGQRPPLSRKRLSFSGSTLAREEEKDGLSPSAKAVEGYSAPVEGAVGEAPQTMSHDLAVAMGKMPPPTSSPGTHFYDSVNTEKSAEPEKPLTTEQSMGFRSSTLGKSALKPSRFSQNIPINGFNEAAKSNAPRTSFQLHDYSSADDEKTDEDAPRIARRIRQGPPQKDGLSDDADDEPPKWTPRNKRIDQNRKVPRRSFSVPNVAEEDDRAAPQRKGSWKPEGLVIGKQQTRSKQNKLAMMQMRRSSSGIPGGDDDNYDRHRSFENSIQGSLTIPRRRSSKARNLEGSFATRRPGIRERSTMGSSSRRLTFAPRSDPNRDSSGAAASTSPDEPPRKTILNSLKSAADLRHHERMRRVAMSSQYQTYIPPKSRNSSVLQAFGHLLAGRTIDVTLWTYSAGFLKVMLFFLLFYILNIFIWAAVLDAVDLATGGKCIHEDSELLRRSERLEFVFELAWATFTTVS